MLILLAEGKLHFLINLSAVVLKRHSCSVLSEMTAGEDTRNMNSFLFWF